jgi:plasmid stability protein
MPDLVIRDLDPGIHARLRSMAEAHGQTLEQFAAEILIAADHLREEFDPAQSNSTRDIRRCRDGGCGFCDELEGVLRGVRWWGEWRRSAREGYSPD